MYKYSQSLISIRKEKKRKAQIKKEVTIIKIFFSVLVLGVALIFVLNCSSGPEYTEFSVSTCPPYCDNDQTNYNNCDEVSEDEDGNKICTTYGRW